MLLSLGNFQTTIGSWIPFSVWSIVHFLKKWSRTRTFSAPVRTCTLRSSSKFACSPKIGCSLFSILITFLSDCSFHANRSARARYRLPCARARSDQVQTLRPVLKLAVLHFLCSSLLSQTAPSVSFLVSQKIYGWRNKTKQKNKFQWY